MVRCSLSVHTQRCSPAHHHPRPSWQSEAIIGDHRQSVAISSNHLPITIGVPAAEEVEHARRVRPKRARELLSNWDAIREAVRKAIRDAIWEAIARRVRPEVQIGANRKAIRDAIWEAISAPSSTEARSRAIGGASTAINGHQRSSVLIRTHQSSDQRSSVLISAH
jgi:hypothetical protein